MVDMMDTDTIINKQESVMVDMMVDTRIFTIYQYLPDSDTIILEAVNTQLTASPSDQNYRRAFLKAKMSELHYSWRANLI